MSNEFSDETEWNEAAANFKKRPTHQGQSAAPPALDNSKTVEQKEEKTLVADGPCQYALHGNGFTTTTNTIKKLPAGIYDIFEDNRCVFAVPQPPPTGLLLELPQMRSDEVIKTVDTFWKSESDYKDGNEFVIGGAQFKSGVMIYGPPGSGKSCTIKIVSQKLVAAGGTVFFASGHPSTIMTWLDGFSRVEPNRKCIVILEDIDTLIENWGEAKYLAMLDSAKTIDNVLFIATTNYPDKLDPRIYNRPGRFAHVIKIGMPVAEAREAFLKATLKNHRDVKYIVDNTEGFSIDHLSALINAVYREKKDLEKSVKKLRVLFEIKPKSENSGPSIGIGSSGGD